jgi:pilus assembly protein Flp/PilA
MSWRLQGEKKMKSIVKSIKNFLVSDDGPTSVEYCFMLGFIILVTIAAIGDLGGATQDLYQDSYEAMS